MRRELIIAGATGNLGRGATDSFPLSEYDRVYLTGRNLDRIKERAGPYELIKTGDLADEKEVERIFGNFEPDKGTAFFLFSTLGGFTGGKSLIETDMKDLTAMLEINLVPSFLLLKHFGRLAAGSGGGSICLTSALTSLRPESGKSVYGSAKCAVNYLVRVSALEGKDDGFSVNAIAPYIIESEENRAWVTDSRLMVSAVEIGSIVNNLFRNYRTMTGNIIEIPFAAGRSGG